MEFLWIPYMKQITKTTSRLYFSAVNLHNLEHPKYQCWQCLIFTVVFPLSFENLPLVIGDLCNIQEYVCK